MYLLHPFVDYLKSQVTSGSNRCGVTTEHINQDAEQQRQKCELQTGGVISRVILKSGSIYRLCSALRERV